MNVVLIFAPNVPLLCHLFPSLTLWYAFPILETILINMVKAHLNLLLFLIFPRIQYFVLDKVDGF